MTGFQYLILSIVLIASATLVSANYRAFGENATFSQLFSLGAICESENLRGLMPVRIDCAYHTSDQKDKVINFKSDERVMR